MKMEESKLKVTILLCFQFIVMCYADTPANCTFEDISGKWTFYETARTMNKHENCTRIGKIERKIKIDLQYPNIAVDEFGNYGVWTMVYNEGFEIIVNERSYFAYSMYTQKNKTVTSFCNRTFPGWSHDVTLRHWACFYGIKQKFAPVKVHQHPHFHSTKLSVPSFDDFSTIVQKVNNKQNKWHASVHQPFLSITHAELLNIRGGKMSWLAHRPQPIEPTDELIANVAGLPKSFDWRDVNGINYVSPIRNQGVCGSCYAFSSMGMLESRLRVKTNNTLQPTFSTQDIVSCSELSQGCEGGFPFLVAGRYAKDFGVVPEKCNPYQGHDGPCTRNTCYKHYTSHYSYVGGYYGGCNEYHMLLALINGGPLSVSFEVHDDFIHYKGGIYHYTGIKGPGFNPFELVNHAVLAVGYGEDETGEKYWIVKNSWGEDWGEDGYFRIRRGVNEVGIESIAVQATPIP